MCIDVNSYLNYVMNVPLKTYVPNVNSSILERKKTEGKFDHGLQDFCLLYSSKKPHVKTVIKDGRQNLSPKAVVKNTTFKRW